MLSLCLSLFADGWGTLFADGWRSLRLEEIKQRTWQTLRDFPRSSKAPGQCRRLRVATSPQVSSPNAPATVLLVKALLLMPFIPELDAAVSSGRMKFASNQVILFQLV